MKRRVLGGATLLAVLIALALLTGGGSGAVARSTDLGAVKGHPRTGSRGIELSVAELIARGRQRDRIAGPPKGLRPKPEPAERPEGGEEPRPEESPRPDIGPRSAEEPGSATEAREGFEGDETPPKIPGPARLEPPVRAPVPGGGPDTPFPAATSFLGAQSSESGFVPPDSMGAVGPSQVLFYENGRVKVFDKSGNLGSLNVSDSTFWSSVRNGQGVSDPGVEYDRLSGRWIVTAINLANSNNRIMVAVSSGPTITNQSSFTFFFFQSNSSGDFADYPQMAVDKNAIYVGTNDFGPISFDNTSAFVIRKSSVTGGGPIVVTAFHNLIGGSGTGPYTPQPALDMDPNVGEGYFIGVDNGVFSQLDIRRVADPGGTPILSGNLTLAVPTTRFPEEVPAQGTSTALDALDDRLFEAMIARKPDNSLSLWTAHNIEVDSSGAGSSSGARDADRWYEIGNLSTSPSLIQSGTMFDSAASNPRFFWIPSIAANGQGHASLNSSTAGVGRRAEVASMGRLATDALNTTQAFTITQSSTFAYNVTVTNPQRWGDYSQTIVDPADNMTFWTFQEYANATNSWGVQAIQLRAPPPATPSSASNVETGGCDTTTVTGTSVSGSGFFDPGPDVGGPGYSEHVAATVSGGVIVNNVSYTDPTHVTLDLDTSAASTGTKTVTIFNPDGQSANGAVLQVDTGSGSPCRTLDVNTQGGGSSTVTSSPAAIDCAPTCSAQFTDGNSVTLIARPAADATFTRWDVTGGGSCPGTGTCTLTMDANKTVTATFNGVAPPPPPTPTTSPNTDTTSPDTKIGKHPKKKTSKRKAKFSFSSSEGGSTFECKRDKQQFKPCTSPKKYRHLKPGKHRFKVKATDLAGNTDPSVATFKWKVLD